MKILEGLGMAQGIIDWILVAIHISIRIQELQFHIVGISDCYPGQLLSLSLEAIYSYYFVFFSINFALFSFTNFICFFLFIMRTCAAYACYRYCL